MLTRALAGMQRLYRGRQYKWNTVVELTILGFLKHNAAIAATLLSVFIIRSQELFWGRWDLISEHFLTLSLHIMHVWHSCGRWQSVRAGLSLSIIANKSQDERLWTDWCDSDAILPAQTHTLCCSNLDYCSPHYLAETWRGSALLSDEKWTMQQWLVVLLRRARCWNYFLKKMLWKYNDVLRVERIWVLILIWYLAWVD